MLHIYEIFYEVLFFVSFLGLIIGIINPGLVIPFGRTKTRVRVIMIYGIALGILFVLLSIVVSINDERRKRVIIKHKGELTKANIISTEKFIF